MNERSTSTQRPSVDIKPGGGAARSENATVQAHQHRLARGIFYESRVNADGVIVASTLAHRIGAEFLAIDGIEESVGREVRLALRTGRRIGCRFFRQGCVWDGEIAPQPDGGFTIRSTIVARINSDDFITFTSFVDALARVADAMTTPASAGRAVGAARPASPQDDAPTLGSSERARRLHLV